MRHVLPFPWLAAGFLPLVRNDFRIAGQRRGISRLLSSNTTCKLPTQQAEVPLLIVCGQETHIPQPLALPCSCSCTPPADPTGLDRSSDRLLKPSSQALPTFGCKVCMLRSVVRQSWQGAGWSSCPYARGYESSMQW